MKRIAVIGAGIAGCGAAWSLARAGFDITLYEQHAALGGNAKTQTWTLSDGREVVTGLSVLAWPDLYFHNYNRLLDELGIATERTPPLRFFVDSDQKPEPGDLARWSQLVAVIRRVNDFFSPGPPSLYRVSPLNPLCVIPLRLVCRAAGISDAFWQHSFVPVHTSSFLSARLSSIPAVIAPALEDIVSVEHGGHLRTWSRDSSDVFEKMTEGVAVRAATPVEAVERSERHIAVHAGGSATYDRVVFACPAPAAVQIIDRPSALERILLGGVHYADHDDDTFAVGVVHSDPGVLPAEHRDEILRHFANYIRCIRKGQSVTYENTFVISSWAPAARDSDLPMMVSYNVSTPIAQVARRIRNTFAHPSLSGKNLMRAMALRLIQGPRVYYCGSYTTPGNGHDLSLLSGLVVAEALGAAYPFAAHGAALRDFEQLRSMMLGGLAPSF